MDKKQATRLAEMLNWLAENPKYANRLCIEGYETRGEELILLIDELVEKEYYEFLAILLIKNELVLEIEQALTKIKTTLITEKITDGKTKELCSNLRHFLLEKHQQNVHTQFKL